MTGKPKHYKLGGEGADQDDETGAFGVTGRASTGRIYEPKTSVSFDVEKIEAATDSLNARRARKRKAAHGKHGIKWRAAVVAEIIAARGNGRSEHPWAEATAIFKRVNTGLKERNIEDVSDDYLAARLEEFPLS